MKRLGHTGIEYAINPDGSRGYAWNFASGCGNNVEGKCNSGGFNCWAYPITKRFADRYPNGFNPTIYPEALLSPLYLKKPSRILCAFMGDLFWDCPEFDPDRWIVLDRPGYLMGNTLKEQVFETVRKCPQHTFVFLTKQPQNLPSWGKFPDNCQVGVTATNADMMFRALVFLEKIRAKVKFLSLEPLLANIPNSAEWDYIKAVIRVVDLVIIGAQTKPTVMPKIEHVQEIVEACDKAEIPVFLKNNLTTLIQEAGMGKAKWAAREWVMCKYPVLRQEMPRLDVPVSYE